MMSKKGLNAGFELGDVAYTHTYLLSDVTNNSHLSQLLWLSIIISNYLVVTSTGVVQKLFNVAVYFWSQMVPEKPDT